MGQPAISVVIPCRNAAEYLTKTLNSVLAQTDPPAEILVIDDGSTDSSDEILSSYGDRIRVFRRPCHGGPAYPRNVGVREAKSELIAFFDADDLMCAKKLSSAAAVFENHPEVGLLFTNFSTIDDNGLPLNEDFLSEYNEFRRFLRPTEGANLSLLSGDDAYRCLLRANFIGASSVVCRADALHEVGPFDEMMKNSGDLDMWRRLANAGFTFGFLNEVHHRYRVHPGSVSRGGSRLYPSWIRGTEKQLVVATEPEDLEHLQEKLDMLWLGYGYALRVEGKRREARAAYRTALGRKFNWAGLKGLLLSFVTSRRGLRGAPDKTSRVVKKAAAGDPVLR